MAMEDFEDMDAVGTQNDGEPSAVVSDTPAETPETPEIEQKDLDAGDDSPEPEETPDPEPEDGHKKETGSQRLKKQRQRLEAENEALRKLLLEKANGSPVQTEAKHEAVVTTQGRPSLDQFETHEEWVEAVADWRYDQRRAKEREEERRETAQSEWDRKIAEGKSKFADFEDALESAPAPSPAVAKHLFRPTTTPEVIHYLATNPDEYNKLNRMKDPDDIAEYMAEIKYKLKTPTTKTKQASSAPPPIKPVTPRASIVVKKNELKGLEDF